MFSLTINFPTLEELRQAVAKLDGPAAYISHADRPDVGASDLPVGPPQQPSALFNPFAAGGAAAPLVPPLAAPSTAAVVPLPTAPAATLPGLPPPPAAPVPPAPSPAAAAPAPSAPAVPASPAGAVPLDSEGMPWDHRIHSGTKARIENGTWRQKRGADPAIVALVKAELRQTMSATAPQAASPAAPLAGLPPAPPAAPASTTPVTFGEFMQSVEPGVSSGKISNLTVATILGEFQLANWFQMAARPDLVPAIAAKFAPHIAAAA